MVIALQVLAVIIIIGSFLPLLPSEIWVVRAWDFPRMQLLVGAIAIGAALAVFGATSDLIDLAVLVLLAAAAIHLAIRIFPYSPLARKQVRPGEGDATLRLLISNVLMDNRDSDSLIELVRKEKPDVLLALETDDWWAERLAVLSESLPHRVSVPQPDTYGMVLMSRLPLVDAEVRHLVRDNIPSIHGRIPLGNGAPEIRFHALHPKPPFPDEDTTSTDRDIELVLVAEQVREHSGPAIVFGDMNDVAWSHTTRLFRRVSGMLDPRIGRGFFSTFHAGHWWMRWPLDHVFVSNDFRVREIRRLPSVGSDHFPILAEFVHDPHAREDQREPSPQGDDLEEKNELLSRAPSA